MGKAKTLRIAKKRSGEKGQATVEFAISIITFLVMIFACFEILMAAYTTSVLADAAKEGVRYAIIKGSTANASCGDNSSANPCSSDPFNVKSRVKDYAQASLHDISNITITVTYPDNTNDPSHPVKVDITYQYVPYISLGFINPRLSTHSEGRIVF